MKRNLISFVAVCILAGKSLAVLVNSASYRDTTLEYYANYDDNINHSGAMARCWQRGGWLVMPKDKSLDAAVTAVSGNNQAWIGLGDFAVEGAYEFIDGSRVTWANWDSKEPNNGIICDDNRIDEDCVLTRSGKWNDLFCIYRRGYVCQIANSQRQQYDYSHFKVYRKWNMSTYKSAADICHIQNSRLVKVNDKFSIDLLFKKLPELSDLSFWVSKYGTGISSSSCYAVSSGGLNTSNCEEAKPFVCETVEPHEVRVSEEKLEVEALTSPQIRCSAFGYPIPEVTWFNGELEVIDQLKKQGHSTMKMHNVTPNDAGLYACRATNVIDDREYRMEAYSIVTVLSDNLSADLNERPPMDDVYGGAKDTAVVSSFESMTDSDMSIPRRLYDDQNGISGFLDQDERRQD